MKNALAPVAALLVGVAILLAGNGLQGTLLPVRASIESFSTFSIGFIGAAYFLGFTVGCLKGAELVALVGHVRVFAAMTALASAAPLAHGLVVNPVAWIGFRLISGFCFAVLFIVIESWLNEQSSNENRGIVFSTYVMITLTLLGVGQMILLLYNPADMHLFAIASVLVSIAAVPVALSTGPKPELPVSVDVDVGRLYRISPAGTVGCFVTGLCNGTFWSLSPLFVATLSDDTNLAAWFMTAGVLGGAAAQWPMGFLSDNLGRRRTMMISASAGAITAALIVAETVPLTPYSVMVLGVVWGASSFPLYAISVAHANDYADPSDYVMVSSGLLLMYGAGAVVGPFIASALMTLNAATGMFLFTGISHLLLVLYAAFRVARRSSSPSDQHIAFSDALATAHTASQVYEEEIQHLAEADEEVESEPT